MGEVALSERGPKADRHRRSGSDPSRSFQCYHSPDGVAAPRSLSAIKDPELRDAFMAAHVAWARRRAPHLLKEWLA